MGSLTSSCRNKRNKDNVKIKRSITSNKNPFLKGFLVHRFAKEYLSAGNGHRLEHFDLDQKLILKNIAEYGLTMFIQTH